MDPLPGAILVILFLGGSAAGGMALRQYLAEHHLRRDSIEVIHLVTTMLVTFAALLLGLMTNSVKASFDTIGNDIRVVSLHLVRLDQALSLYGPDMIDARRLLAGYTQAAIAGTWHDRKPAGRAVDLANDVSDTTLAQISLILRNVHPQSKQDQLLITTAQRQLASLDDARTRVVQSAHDSIGAPFFLVLAFWMSIVFANLGLSAPRNMLVFATLLLGVVSIASVIYIILDLDTPFDGNFEVSRAPLQDALAMMRSR